MNPGRELDVLVAEKAMGLEVKSEGRYEVGPVYKTEPNAKGFTGEESIPHYSTDITAAWQVVEKMGIYLDGHGTKWVAWSQGHKGIEASTAPHAICLAALKAVGAI